MDVCVRACMRVSVCMCVRVCVCGGGSGVDFSKFDQEGGSDFPHKKGGIGKIGCGFKNWGGGKGGGVSLVLGKNFVPFLTKLKKKGGERVSKIRGRGDWVS